MEVEVNGIHHAQAIVPPGKKPGAIEQGAEWAPEPVWMFWNRDKPLVLFGIRIAS